MQDTLSHHLLDILQLRHIRLHTSVALLHAVAHLFPRVAANALALSLVLHRESIIRLLFSQSKLKFIPNFQKRRGSCSHLGRGFGRYARPHADKTAAADDARGGVRALRLARPDAVHQPVEGGLVCPSVRVGAAKAVRGVDGPFCCPLPTCRRTNSNGLRNME